MGGDTTRPGFGVLEGPQAARMGMVASATRIAATLWLFLILIFFSLGFPTLGGMAGVFMVLPRVLDGLWIV